MNLQPLVDALKILRGFGFGAKLGAGIIGCGRLLYPDSALAGLPFYEALSIGAAIGSALIGLLGLLLKPIIRRVSMAIRMLEAHWLTRFTSNEHERKLRERIVDSYFDQN